MRKKAKSIKYHKAKIISVNEAHKMNDIHENEIKMSN